MKVKKLKHECNKKTQMSFNTELQLCYRSNDNVTRVAKVTKVQA